MNQNVTGYGHSHDTEIRIIFKMQDTETRIYILYNFKLYKLKTDIYVQKFV